MRSLLALPCLVILSGALEALLYHADLSRGCGNSARGLLLKGVKHVYNLREPHRIDGAICVAIEIIHDLKHAGSPEPLERLRI